MKKTGVWIYVTYENNQGQMCFDWLFWRALP